MNNTNLNSLFEIRGFIATDPVDLVSKEGNPGLQLRVGINSSKETGYLTMKAWGSVADCLRSLVKGNKIHVSGYFVAWSYPKKFTKEYKEGIFWTITEVHTL